MADGFYIRNSTPFALRFEAYDANSVRIAQNAPVVGSQSVRYISTQHIGSADFIFVLCFYDDEHFNPPPGINIVADNHGEGHSGGGGFSVQIPNGWGFGVSASGGYSWSVTGAFAQPSAVARMDLVSYPIPGDMLTKTVSCAGMEVTTGQNASKGTDLQCVFVTDPYSGTEVGSVTSTTSTTPNPAAGLTTTWPYLGRTGDMVLLGIDDGVSSGNVGYLVTKLSLQTPFSAEPWSTIPNSGNVGSVTLMKDGGLLGVGRPMSGPFSPDLQGGGQLYTRRTLYTEWELVQGSVPVWCVTTMKDGVILAVGTDGKLYKKTQLTAPWDGPLPNSAGVRSVAMVATDQSLLGVGAGGDLFTKRDLTENSQWVLAASTNGTVISVSILQDGTILAISQDHKLHTMKSLPSTPTAAAWNHIPDSGAVLAVCEVPKSYLNVVGW